MIFRPQAFKDIWRSIRYGLCVYGALLAFKAYKYKAHGVGNGLIEDLQQDPTSMVLIGFLTVFLGLLIPICWTLERLLTIRVEATRVKGPSTWSFPVSIEFSDLLPLQEKELFGKKVYIYKSRSTRKEIVIHIDGFPAEEIRRLVDSRRST